jgi:copper chaperone CopZ
MRAFVTSLSLLAVVSLATACERSESSSTDDTHATQVVGAVALPPEPTLPAVPSAPPVAEAAEAEGSCGGSCGGGGGESCGGSSCGCEAAMATRAPRNVPADAVWTQVDVKGMRCGGCEKKIEAALAGIEGVYDVDADHSAGRVRIATAPTARDVRDRVVPQIESLGFRTH